MTVGERIEMRRKELGLTQEELARKMGYSGKSIISKTENKKNDIRLDTVSKFAKALDCSESYLMGWEDEEEVDFPRFSPDHIELISLYEKLSDDKKKLLMNFLKGMIE